MPNHSITPNLDYYGTKAKVEFNGSCTFNHGKVVNIYIVYEISKNINISEYPTLENCLFGAVILTKYKYSGYGIDFDRHGSLSFPGTGLGRNVIVFALDMSSSTKITNRKKRYFDSGKTSNTGFQIYTKCRKNAFN